MSMGPQSEANASLKGGTLTKMGLRFKEWLCVHFPHLLSLKTAWKLKQQPFLKWKISDPLMRKQAASHGSEMFQIRIISASTIIIHMPLGTSSFPPTHSCFITQGIGTFKCYFVPVYSWLNTGYCDEDQSAVGMRCCLCLTAPSQL